MANKKADIKKIKKADIKKIKKANTNTTDFVIDIETPKKQFVINGRKYFMEYSLELAVDMIENYPKLAEELEPLDTAFEEVAKSGDYEKIIPVFEELKDKFRQAFEIVLGAGSFDDLYQHNRNIITVMVIYKKIVDEVKRIMQSNEMTEQTLAQFNELQD